MVRRILNNFIFYIVFSFVMHVRIVKLGRNGMLFRWCRVSSSLARDVREQ